MELDDLYGLPLDRFIAERATLVRALRSAGDREEATAVAATRKPSVAAWAVNQLVRSRRSEVAALLRAGDALREAQAGVLSGGADAQDLRAAADAERGAVDDLVETARGLLSSSGQELSATTLERVADTLHAAALDDEAREQVSEGRLVRELRHVGLGDGLGGAFAAPPPSSRPAKPAKSASGKSASRKSAADKPAAGEAAKERRQREAAEQRERDAARKQARANERDAAREVERAERAVRGAEDRLSRAEEALRQAKDAAAEAQAGLQAAIAARRQARQQLDSI